MRKLYPVLMGLAALSWAATVQAEQPVSRRGTSVLHYLTRNDWVVTPAGSNVTGSLRLQFNEQGHALKQSLQVNLSGLDPSATYTLTAVVGEDTNPVPVGSVSTDAAGRARLRYFSVGGASGHGHNVSPPSALDPLTNIRALGLDNANTQTVASVWIADATRFQYLVKRNLTPDDTNGTAAGSVSLIANPQNVSFRLLAGGLNPTNDYRLSLNSNVVTMVQTDTAGRLQIKSWPSNAPGIFELRLLQVLDASSNAVLHTSLPR